VVKCNLNTKKTPTRTETHGTVNNNVFFLPLVVFILGIKYLYDLMRLLVTWVARTALQN